MAVEMVVEMVVVEMPVDGEGGDGGRWWWRGGGGPYLVRSERVVGLMSVTHLTHLLFTAIAKALITSTPTEFELRTLLSLLVLAGLCQ